MERYIPPPSLVKNTAMFAEFIAMNRISSTDTLNMCLNAAIDILLHNGAEKADIVPIIDMMANLVIKLEGKVIHMEKVND